MAEGVGFEPTIPVKVCQFSRLVHSSTLPTLLFKSSLQRSFLASEVILLLYMAGQQYSYYGTHALFYTKGQGTSLLGSNIGIVGLLIMVSSLLARASISIIDVRDNSSS